MFENDGRYGWSVKLIRAGICLLGRRRGGGSKFDRGLVSLCILRKGLFDKHLRSWAGWGGGLAHYLHFVWGLW